MSNIQLYNGDCLEIMDKLIAEGVKVDAIITDPPYGMNFQSNYRKNKYDKIENDNNLQEWINVFVEKSYVLLTNNSCFYSFCSWHNIDVFKQAIEKKFTIKNTLVWVKNNTGMGDLKGSYAPKYEMIIFATKGRFIFKHRYSDILEYKRTGNKYHPTEKPVDLLEFLISNSSKEGNTILDPFMGSGTTGVACKNTNRNFIGIELDENYFDIAEERIKGITND